MTKQEAIIEKQKELDKLRKSYIDFIGEQLSDNAMFLKVHGITCSEKDVKIGAEYRKQMNALESELQTLESQEVITTDEDIEKWADDMTEELQERSLPSEKIRIIKRNRIFGAKAYRDGLILKK